MGLKKNYFKYLEGGVNSPVKQNNSKAEYSHEWMGNPNIINPNENAGTYNRLFDERIQELRQKMIDERKHIKDVQNKVSEYKETPQHNLSEEDYNWLYTGGDPSFQSYEHQQPLSGCNSYATSMLGDCGAVVPQNHDGGVMAWNHLTNENEWLESGARTPTYPSNEFYDRDAEKLGMELQPEGTYPTEPGDNIRVGHDYGGTSHSVISLGAKQGEDYNASYNIPNIYNPGDITEGLKMDSGSTNQSGFSYGDPRNFVDQVWDEKTHKYRSPNINEDTNQMEIDDPGSTNQADRVFRYQGSLPYFEQQFEELTSNNKFRNINSVTPAGIQELEPEPVELLKTPQIQQPLTKKQLRKLVKNKKTVAVKKETNSPGSIKFDGLKVENILKDVETDNKSMYA